MTAEEGDPDSTASEPAVLPPTSVETDQATPTTVEQLPVIEADPGVLVWVHDREPPGLHADDPDNPSDLAYWVQQGLLEGLFGVSAENVFYPELLAAEPDLEQLNSGTIVISFELRDGLTWSDGTPLTSADVAYTHEIIVEGCEIENDRSIVDATNNGCEYELINRFGYELVTDFEVVSDTEFKITMASFYGGWRGLYSTIFAAHAFGETARDVNGRLTQWLGSSGPLPSSGPLTFDRWEPGSSIHLTTNASYHGSVSPDAVSEGPATIEGVQIVFVNDIEDRVQLLLDGQAHITMDLPDPAFTALNDAEGFVVSPSVGAVFEHWGLNLLNDHLAKPEVREAIAYAVDKAAVVAELYEPILGPVLDPDGLGNTFWMPNQQPYEDHQSVFAGANVDAAGARLTEAGYRLGSDGVWTHPVDGRLRLRAGTTAGVLLRDRQLELIIAQLAEAGIEVVEDSQPGGLFFSERPFAEASLEASASEGQNGNPGIWDIAQFSWTSGPWPGAISGVFRSASSSNPYGFNNPEYDVAATDCNAEPDDALRSACYNQLDRFVTTLEEGTDGLFVIPITQKPRFFGYSALLASGAVAPDNVLGGPLVNAADYRFQE